MPDVFVNKTAPGITIRLACFRKTVTGQVDKVPLLPFFSTACISSGLYSVVVDGSRFSRFTADVGKLSHTT